MTMDVVVRWATKFWADATEVTSRLTPRVSGARKAPPPRRALRPARPEVTHPIARALLAHAPSPSLSGGTISRRPVRLGQKALHRLHPRLAKNLHAASVRLVAEYDGKVENIWPDGLHLEELQRRLASFGGLGPKLRSMAIRILVDVFGRRFIGWEKVDVAVDRHVTRVFLRTGLVDGPAGARRVSVAQNHDAVVDAARKHCEAYPAALDFPAYDIGKTWCKAETPQCGGCPLRRACPQARRSLRIG